MDLAALLPPNLPPPIAPERGGYTVTMREGAGADEVLGALAAQPPAENRLHVGWGSFRNLDIAAARRCAGMLLLDINLHQFRVWDAVRAALCDPACDDVAAFVELAEPRFPRSPRLRQFAQSTREWLLADAGRAGSWLGDAERFAWIRGLFRDGRVATGCLDMRDAGGLFARFAERLAGAQLDTLYVSNLPWMFAQREGFFGEPGDPAVLAQARSNLALVASRFSCVIEAGRLASMSQPGNLQWHTRLLSPRDFLADDYWAALQPLAGPFRSLR